MHLINVANAQVSFVDIKANEIEKKNYFSKKIPTITYPFLETKEGNISQSNAILYYICNKFKPELLGDTTFKRAKINQWIEFMSSEINENLNKCFDIMKDKFPKKINSEQYKILKILENVF